MLAAPIAAGRAHPALHFVKNQNDFVLVTNFAQLLQPFATEMVVSSLALNRLDDDRADVDLALVDERSDLLLRFLFTLDHVTFPGRFRQRKIQLRSRNARPIEFSEQIGLARIGISQTHGVASAAVKSVTEMQNLRAALAATGRHVFEHLPIHRRFQAVFDRERTAFDEKIAIKWWQTHNACKGFHKFSVRFRVNIRVRHLYLRGAQEISLNIWIVKVGMIEPDRHGAEKSVEID